MKVCGDCLHHLDKPHEVGERACDGWCRYYPQWVPKNKVTVACTGKYKNKNTKVRRVKGCPEYTQEFKDFWEAFPKKVAQDAAWKAWRDEIKLPPQHYQLAIERAGVYAQAIVDEDKDMKYVKHPATWLNGGCWKDKIDSKASKNECYLCHAPYSEGYKYPWIDGKLDKTKRVCTVCRKKL